MNPLAWLATRIQFGRRALRFTAAGTVVASVMIVVTGGIVRVTGSGLGCPTWPSCTSDSLAATREMGIHGAIEFGNRMLTGVLCVAVGALIIVARCQRHPLRSVTRGAWLQFWMVVLNAVVGGVTVLARLSPYVVAAHFLAAMLLLAAAVYTHEAIGIHHDPYAGTGAAASRARIPSTILLALTVIVIVIGTGVTGTGIHAGDSSDVPRMGFDWLSTLLVHAFAATGLIAVTAVLMVSARRSGTGRLSNQLSVFAALLIAQAGLGIAQSVIGHPEPLIVVHMLLATLIMAGAIRIFLTVHPHFVDRRAGANTGALAPTSPG